MADLLDQMRRNPRGNWTISDVERLCSQYGLTCLAPKRGSHYKVSRPDHPMILTIPFKRPIKPVYIRHLIHLIEEKEDGN